MICRRSLTRYDWHHGSPVPFPTRLFWPESGPSYSLNDERLCALYRAWSSYRNFRTALIDSRPAIKRRYKTPQQGAHYRLSSSLGFWKSIFSSFNEEASHVMVEKEALAISFPCGLSRLSPSPTTTKVQSNGSHADYHPQLHLKTSSNPAKPSSRPGSSYFWGL